MIDSVKKIIKEELELFYKENYEKDINIVVNIPKNKDNGDLTIPSFVISKVLKKNPKEVSDEVINILNKNDFIDEVNFVSGFINISFNKEKVIKSILDEIINDKSNYGNTNKGYGKTICIDYSAPNIAKRFGIGHLRSTIIGNSIKKISKKNGYNVVGINHLGDWGTQFGKLIYAYKNFGDKEAIEIEPIKELMRIYVLFHKMAETDESLLEKGRIEFSKLENGDEENYKLWEYFREISIREFMQMYDLLDVEFDSFNGEGFYHNKTASVIELLEKANLLELDDNAYVVKLEGDIPPALIKKSDGATLYMTRDLAAVLYRIEEYNFDKMIYVVGSEQRLHFQQLIKVVDRLGYECAKNIEHVNFGLYLTDGKKMSTRKGKSVTLMEVIEESCKLAKEYIYNKNGDIDDLEEISKKIGIGAVVFNDLKNLRTNDIEFNIDSMTKFEGQTGPYLQYTAVRIKSLLKNSEIDNTYQVKYFDNKYAYDLIKNLSAFKVSLQKALDENAPSYIAKYLLTLATSFNSYYSNEKINVLDTNEKNSKLVLCNSVLQVIEIGFDLLGMKSVERM